MNNSKLRTPKNVLKQKMQNSILYTHTNTRVTLNDQITLYLYNSIKSSKELRVVCETFAIKDKCLII